MGIKTIKPFGALLGAERGLWKHKSMWIAGAVLALIPLINFSIFLGSMWDPYAKLADLPVALVNLDEGANFQGKDYKLGDELQKNLLEAKSFKFDCLDNPDSARKALREGSAYFAVIVPKDFSAMAVAGKKGRPGKIELLVSEGMNLFATRIAESGASTIVAKLNASLNEARWKAFAELSPKIADGFTAIRGALRQIDDGAKTLSEKLGQASEGAAKLASGQAQFGSGVSALLDGVEKLKAGLVALDKAAPDKAKLDLLREGLKTLNEGAATLASGCAALADGGKSLGSGATELANGNSQLAKSVAGNILSPKELKEGTAQLSEGAKKLAEGCARLAALLQDAKTGSQSLATGADALAKGVNTLIDGNLAIKSALDAIVAALPASTDLEKLRDAQAQLASGSSTLAEAGIALASGAKKLEGGINQLFANVPASMGISAGDPEGMATSVVIEETKLTLAPNNGSGFAPYFMGINIWIGALMSSFLFPYLQIPKKGSALGQVKRAFAKLAIPAIFVSVQAIFILIGARLLGVDYVNAPLAYVSAIVSSLCFLVLVFSLILLLGDGGRLLAIVLLILQAGTSSGSFPIELSSPFFQAMHGILPMTATLEGLRSGISGAYEGQFGMILLRLGITTVVAFLLALLGRRKWQVVEDDAFGPLVKL